MEVTVQLLARKIQPLQHPIRSQHSMVAMEQLQAPKTQLLQLQTRDHHNMVVMARLLPHRIQLQAEYAAGTLGLSFVVLLDASPLFSPRALLTRTSTYLEFRREHSCTL